MTFDEKFVARDVWGRPKAVAPVELDAALFTYGVPAAAFRQRVTAGDAAWSTVDGELVGDSGTAAGIAILQARRCPRYQPNRGHVYSTATFEIERADGYKARWGLGTSRYGYLFEYDGDADALYIVRRQHTGSVAPTPETFADGGGAADNDRIEIANAAELDEFGIGVNRLWDIRFQWRGAGDVEFLVDQRLAGKLRRLGIESAVSSSVPALPARFELENTGLGGDNRQVRFGCYSIASEGGTANPRTQRVPLVTSADVAGIGAEQCILAATLGDFLAGIQNTRDALLQQWDASPTARSIARVYIGSSAMVTATWAAVGGGSALRWAEGVAITAFDATKGRVVAARRVEANGNVDPGDLYDLFSADWLTAAQGEFAEGPDVVAITIEKDGGGATSASASLVLGEEV